MSIIDFEDSLTDLVKSEGANAAKGALAKLGLPDNIPGIGPVTDIIAGISSGSAKGIVGAAGSVGGGVLGSVFAGPIGGSIGAKLGALVSELVPNTDKENRIHREASRTKNDIKALAANPVTDENLVSRFDSGNIIVGLSIGADGKDVPGSQNPKEYKYYRFANGKKQTLTREQLLVILKKDKSILQTASNVIGHKLLEAYKQLKKAKPANAPAKVSATTTNKPAKTVSDTVQSALANSKELKALADNQKKQAKSVAEMLASIAKQQKKADTRHKEDHVILGELITKVASKSKDTGDTVNALATVLQDSAAIPKKYQNLFGGKGFIKLVNKA